MIMCDVAGVIYEGRTEEMNPYKARFARKTEKRTLADALRGADVFIGLSVANIVTPEMLLSHGPASDRVCARQSRSGGSL